MAPLLSSSGPLLWLLGLAGLWTFGWCICPLLCPSSKIHRILRNTTRCNPREYPSICLQQLPAWPFPPDFSPAVLSCYTCGERRWWSPQFHKRSSPHLKCKEALFLDASFSGLACRLWTTDLLSCRRICVPCRELGCTTRPGGRLQPGLLLPNPLS